jgi:hypothetical protein
MNPQISINNINKCHLQFKTWVSKPFKDGMEVWGTFKTSKLSKNNKILYNMTFEKFLQKN